MTAVNYARNRVSGEYVFLAKHDLPEPRCFGSDWVWYSAPARELIGEFVERYHLVNEGPGAYCVRLDHAPRCCEKCRAGGLRDMRSRGVS
jgi:hypothetical protein